MSKSLGNGVDPMDVIDDYGCDSLRYFLATSTAPGMDLRYDTEKVKSTWKFYNKLWNASRFVLMKLDGFKEEDYTLDNLKVEDKWILDKLNSTIKDVTKYMDKYDFNLAGPLYTSLHGVTSVTSTLSYLSSMMIIQQKVYYLEYLLI